MLEGTDADDGGRGAYVVDDADDDAADVVLVATGSEVHLCVDAAALLAEQDVSARVVSMPSWELFDEQDEEYQEDVLPRRRARAVRRGRHHVRAGRAGPTTTSAIDQLRRVRPRRTCCREFGFTPEAVADAALDLLED